MKCDLKREMKRELKCDKIVSAIGDHDPRLQPMISERRTKKIKAKL